MAVTVFALCMLLLVLLPAAFFFTNYPLHRRKYDSKDQSEVSGAARSPPFFAHTRAVRGTALRVYSSP
jgi:hypothetical protein